MEKLPTWPRRHLSPFSRGWTGYCDGVRYSSEAPGAVLGVIIRRGDWFAVSTSTPSSCFWYQPSHYDCGSGRGAENCREAPLCLLSIYLYKNNKFLVTVIDCFSVQRPIFLTGTDPTPFQPAGAIGNYYPFPISAIKTLRPCPGQSCRTPRSRGPCRFASRGRPESLHLRSLTFTIS